jgi:hypothetical protein
MSEAASTHMEQLLARAEERIAALESRLAKLDSQSVSATSSMDEVSSRRGLFKLAGAVATGAIAQTVVSASPAAASTTGPYVGLGVAETGTTSTPTSFVASGPTIAFQVTNNTAGIVAGAGISGESANGFGVYGSSVSGYGIYAGGAGRIGMSAHVTEGPPTTGTYALGDIVKSADGSLWTCSAAGNPGQWFRLSVPSTAATTPTGITILLNSPSRDYVSVGTATNPILPSTPRTVTLGSLPVGAKGALISVTVVSPSAWVQVFPASGYLSVVAGGGNPGFPSVGFTFGTLQNTGLVVTAVNAQRQVTLGTLGQGGCHALLDVLGYYL